MKRANFEKTGKIIILVLLMLLVGEVLCIRTLKSEQKEKQMSVVSVQHHLQHNTRPYDVPFYLWIEGVGDAKRIHKLEAVISQIRVKEPEMYQTFIDEGWHFVLTDRNLGRNHRANTSIAGQCNSAMKCIYILNTNNRVIWHEFGHFIDIKNQTSSKTYFKKIHDEEWMETTDAYNLLTLNTSTSSEYFAEMYSFFRVNGIPSDDACPMTKEVFRNLFSK